MMKKPNKKTVLIVSVLIILCLGIWTLWGNIALEVNEYEIVSDRIPEAFAGFRIAQVSDLHNEDFGEGYGQLLTLLSQINPDIIVVTGGRLFPEWMDVDVENFKGTIKNLPTREMIDVPVNEMLIVELYSK